MSLDPTLCLAREARMFPHRLTLLGAWAYVATDSEAMFIVYDIEDREYSGIVIQERRWAVYEPSSHAEDGFRCISGGILDRSGGTP